MRWPFMRAGKGGASVDRIAKAPAAEKSASPLKSAFSSRTKESVVEERVTSSAPPQLGDLDLGALARAVRRLPPNAIVTGLDGEGSAVSADALFADAFAPLPDPDPPAPSAPPAAVESRSSGRSLLEPGPVPLPAGDDLPVPYQWRE